MAANYQRSNKPFNFNGSRFGHKTIVVAANNGTATLQALCGDDPDSDAWVDVPGGTWSADTVYTFYADVGQYFRITLTGSAVCNVTG